VINILAMSLSNNLLSAFNNLFYSPSSQVAIWSHICEDKT